jgi:hypothetical protein
MFFNWGSEVIPRRLLQEFSSYAPHKRNARKNETFEKLLFTYSYELFDPSTGWLTKS